MFQMTTNRENWLAQKLAIPSLDAIAHEKGETGLAVVVCIWRISQKNIRKITKSAYCC